MTASAPAETVAAPPPVSLGRRALGFARWVFESFGPLILFYIVEHRYGLVPAIVSGVATSVALVAFQIVREKSPSRLTLLTAASVVVFGALDLTFRSAFFIKLEPVLGNVVWAGFFLGSVLTGKPLLVELVQKQRGVLPDFIRGYLRALTIAWSGFFLVRAAAYLWAAFALTIDQALAFRAVVGPASLGAMFGGEILLRYLRFGKKAFATAPVADVGPKAAG